MAPVQAGRYGLHYTTHLLDPSLKHAYIAVCNPRLRLLVLYLFNRSDYPWVGNCEESYNREHVPWKGRELCRGFEFSSTSFPIPRRETVTAGPLFGESTHKWLPARTGMTSKYMILLVEVSQDFAGVMRPYFRSIVRVTEVYASRFFWSDSKRDQPEAFGIHISWIFAMGRARLARRAFRDLEVETDALAID